MLSSFVYLFWMHVAIGQTVYFKKNVSGLPKKSWTSIVQNPDHYLCFHLDVLPIYSVLHNTWLEYFFFFYSLSNRKSMVTNWKMWLYPMVRSFVVNLGVHWPVVYGQFNFFCFWTVSCRLYVYDYGLWGRK